MRRVAILTTGRQDYGVLRSTCQAVHAASDLELVLLVAGMHLDPEFGRTVEAVRADGLPIAAELATRKDATSPAREAGATVPAVAEALERLHADCLLVVGDRSETAAAALGATIARVPIVHLHGGEETEGAIDNALRHAITKLSHLHLVSHPDHARRVRQMGEPDESVVVVGAPGLDNLHRKDLPDRAALERHLGLALRAPVVVVTHHSATLGGPAEEDAHALTTAMRRIDATYVITLPNADAGSEVLRAALIEFAAQSRGRAVAVAALGEARYFGLLRLADAMLGNSSSGLIEAPVFRLPVVNVGDRQKGRLRGANVIDVPVSADAIAGALERVLASGFRPGLADMVSPFGDGHSAPRIVRAISSMDPGGALRKRFVDRSLA